MMTMKRRLVAMQNDLRGDLASDVAALARELDDKGEDTTPSQHPADVASDLYAREEMVTEELTLARDLGQVDEALERLANGTYGVCVDCGQRIAPERLAALPQAARCITCQRRSERPNLRRR
jgi:DnaK suppressor protein